MPRPLPSRIPRWIEAQPKVLNAALPDFTVYEDQGKIVVTGGRVLLLNMDPQFYYFLPAVKTTWPAAKDGSIYLKFEIVGFATVSCEILAGATLPANAPTDWYVLLASVTAGKIVPAAGGLGPIFAAYPF